jgi:hypothetical protein
MGRIVGQTEFTSRLIVPLLPFYEPGKASK